MRFTDTELQIKNIPATGVVTSTLPLNGVAFPQ